jgi:hypothetical protein
MTDDTDDLATQVADGGAIHAARQLANDLAGLLWRREQDAADPDETATWRTERGEVRARQRQLTAGSPEVDEALRAWGDRIRELRA